MTIPPGAADAILSYVRKKAAEWTPEEMAIRISAAVSELETAARAVAPELLDVRAAGQEWSPLECLRHAAEVNTGTAARVRGVVTDGRIPDEVPSVPKAREAILEAQASVIAGATAAVREGHGDPEAAITWLHPFLGELNWREWFLTIRVHSLDHARQLPALQRAGS